MLAHHGVFFRHEIATDADQLYKSLLSCKESGKAAVNKHIEGAMSAFLQQISLSSEERCGALIKQLITDYLSVLDGYTNLQSLVFAAKCIADLAPALSSADEGKARVIAAIIEASARYDFRGALNSSESNSSLFFFYAVTKLLNSSEMAISDYIMTYVTSTAQRVIMEYPFLSVSSQALVSQSICCLFGAVEHSKLIFSSILESVIPLVFFRSIARLDLNEQRRPVRKVVDPLSDIDDERLFVYYLFFWCNILSGACLEANVSTDIQNISAKGFYELQVGPCVLDKLLETFLKFLTSIDLSYSSRTDVMSLQNDSIEASEAAPLNYIPRNIADQELLVNAASFLDALLSKLSFSRIAHWLSAFVDVLIPLSREYPVISALYRILKALGSNVLKPDQAVLSEHEASLRKLSEFIIEQSTSLPLFEGELLDTFLSFGIAIGHFLPLSDISPVLHAVLIAGLQVIPAIQLLSKSVGSPALISLLPTILPALDVYLIDPSLSSDIREKDTNFIPRKKRWRVSGLRNAAAGDFETSRVVMRFLGRLGGHNRLLLTSPLDALYSLTSNSTGANTENSSLEFQLAMPSFSKKDLPAFALNVSALIPQLLAVCTESLRIAEGSSSSNLVAFELLHASILFMIGTSAVAINKSNRFSSQYRRIFPVMIRIATAQEHTRRQLFEILLFQVIHWFSGFGHVHEEDASALIDTLIDQICGSDGTLRHLGLRGLEEFFKWSLKQASKHEVAKHPGSSHALLERLFILCNHPSEEMRLAAALQFHRFFSILRDESSLVHKYILKIVLELLKAMRLPSLQPLKKECFSTAQKYVDLIVRSVCQRNDVFGLRQPDPTVRFHPNNVADIIYWCWENIANDSSSFFRECVQKLLYKLIPALEAGLTLPEFIARQLKVQDCVALFEGSRGGGTEQILSLSVEACVADRSMYVKWLHALNVALDCHVWCLSSNTSAAMSLFLVDKSKGATALKRKAGAVNLVSSPSSSLLSHISAFWTNVLSSTSNCQEALTLHGEIFFRSSQLINYFLSQPEATSMLFMAHDSLLSFYHLLSFALLSPAPYFRPSDEYISSHLMLFCEEQDLLIHLRSLSSSDVAEIFSELLSKRLKRLLEDERPILSAQFDIMQIKSLHRFITLFRKKWPTVISVLIEGDSGRNLLYSLAIFLLEELHSAFSLGKKQKITNATLILRFCLDIIKYNIVLVLDLLQKGTTQDIDFIRISVDEFASFWRQNSSDVMKAGLYHLFGFIMENQNVLSEGVFQFLEVLLLQEQSSLFHIEVLIESATSHLQGTSFGRIMGQLLYINSKSRCPNLRLLETCVGRVEQVLSGKRSSITELQQCFAFIPYLVSGCSTESPRPYHMYVNDPHFQYLERVTESIEEMVAARYPLSTNGIDPNSKYGKDFELILCSHLELIKSCGCVDFFDQLIPLLREGPQHIYYHHFRATIQDLGTHILEDPTYISPLKLVVKLHPLIFSHESFLNLRQFFFDNLLVPFFKHCSMTCLEYIMCSTQIASTSLKEAEKSNSFIRKIVDVVTTPVADMHSQTFAYTLLSLVYDRLPLEKIRTSITTAFMGSVQSTGKELTKQLCSAASILVSSNPDTATFMSMLKVAAYNCKHDISRDSF